jgi:cytidyltransferase-like protein
MVTKPALPPCFIFPGRFQPFHNDHFRILDKLLKAADERIVILGVVVHMQYETSDTSEFEEEARRQNSAERNPWSSIQRLRMLARMIRHEFSEYSDRCYPILLPRPEVHWPLINSMFPGKRVWVVPAMGEDFDDMKAAFFRSMSEEVYRPVMHPTTDGRRIRDLWFSGKQGWVDDVPQSIAAAIMQLRSETQ